jgi:hypothetical protein
MSTLEGIQRLVKEIATLSNGLPPSVPNGTKDDKIWRIMNGQEGETAFETFNKRFDAMFAEELRSPDGRLLHIRRGKLGMGLICSYLLKTNWTADFTLDLVEIKLLRLTAELTILRYVYEIYSSTYTDRDAEDRIQISPLAPDQHAMWNSPQN